MSFRVFWLLIILATSLRAAPEVFEGSSLKYLYEVSLNKKGGVVYGVFKRSEYGVNRRAYPFEGKVIPAPKGRTGTFLQIDFSKREIAKNGNPYDFAPGTREIVWRLADHKGGTRLFIPILSKTDANPPTWKLSDLEFEPKGADR